MDTLFNQRDYIAAKHYWSPKYIQHSAHIPPGREGLFNLVKNIPPTLKYEPSMLKFMNYFATIIPIVILDWVRVLHINQDDGWLTYFVQITAHYIKEIVSVTIQARIPTILTRG